MTQKKETSNSVLAISPKAMNDPNTEYKKMKTRNGSTVSTASSSKKEKSTTISKKISTKGAPQQNIEAEHTSNTTLYVSRLHHKLGFKQFKMHFEQFGQVNKCYLSETGNDHNNKGFGFVTYQTEQDMKTALEAQHELKGQAAVVQINKTQSKTSEKVSKKRKHQDDASAGPPSKKMCPLNHEIYVGGLPADTSTKKIKKHFSHFGEVANVFEPKKLDSKGLKYFFVGFKEASSLQTALEAKEHEINKTQACLKLRKDGKNIDEPAKGKCSAAVLRNADPAAYERTVFVGELEYKTKASAVLEHFSKYGKVTGLTMPRHPREGGQNKGFALVEFDTSVAFQKALKAKKHKIDEKVVKVTESQEPKSTKGKKEKKVATDKEKYELFVAEIPASINNKALGIHFSSYGTVVAVNRPMRQNQRTVRNYAFVQYKTREGLMAALADTKHKIAGEPLVVRESKGTDKKSTGKENVKVITHDNSINDAEEEEDDDDEDEDDDDEEDDDE